MTQGKVKYVVLDDVELTRNFLTQVVSTLRPAFTLAGTADEVSRALDMIMSCSPQLIFSKVSLSDNNVIPMLSNSCPDCPVVLISEYDEKSVNHSGIRMVDYLLEPVTPENVGRALEKFNKLINYNNQPQYSR